MVPAMILCGGEGGIRTHVPLAGQRALQARTFGRSVTSPLSFTAGTLRTTRDVVLRRGEQTIPGERDVVLSGGFFRSYAKPAADMAERVGFEPTNGQNPLHDFESCAFIRSATSPQLV